MAPSTVMPPKTTTLRTPNGSAPLAHTTVPVTVTPLVTASPAGPY
jgi:hypothetical protein